MQSARQFVGRGAQWLQISAWASGPGRSTKGQCSHGLLREGATLDKRASGLSSANIVRFQCSRTPTEDAFAKEYTPVFGSHLAKVLERPAVQDDTGSYSYTEVYQLAGAIHERIINKGGVQPTIAGDTPCIDGGDGGRLRIVPRVAYLCPGDVRYVATLWAIWKNGLCAVPLFHEHPISLMEYYVNDPQVSLIIGTKEFEPKLKELGSKTNTPVLILGDTEEIGLGPSWDNTPKWYGLETYDALIMYTSGTTGPPKGVVHRHVNLWFQASQIRDAWQWTDRDRMLHALPLHHTHGIVSGILTPLYSGACIRMLRKFDPARIWQHLLLEVESENPVSIFMGVPTMYVQLLSFFKNHLASSWPTDKVHKAIRSHIRLLISGSAALPEPIYRQIKEIMGIEVLERYGMTEVGVPLSNNLHGKRYVGYVGFPTRGSEILIAELEGRRIVKTIAKGDYNGSTIYEKDTSGDLLLRGPFVFNRYWNKKERTREAFSECGWFITGDIAQCIMTENNGSKGVYKILGRASTDIIKSGGYKISALDVEKHLLSHPDTDEVTVVGVPDEIWGERVAAIVVLKSTASELQLDSLRAWCKKRMASYSAPTILKIVPKLERNYLGKINKKELVKKLFPSSS
ncbi:acyl-CoA synthetase family member 3, mitochondrial-like [Varroa destructor]|uniref:Uncharacterized protein n=1 Tax=Varroa destructor TaxID=109461 RepID=A0A7M7KGN2_VARDE|nr:acyl-CoA synthetase family member 3, mitochondrial-like [Varroa destructor]XP_022666533.1 acyl-CoA synthetase family member 3, mitochondrial-like [Varroa destructor]XP_022666534.1 acyl-CoA synthetase family member 3, mitochondrial-like [Varroa destructor]XP_022666535.1 acyl-CoA synthetase family member 3, mitochondrial-like [Varroa destructor]XP_022666536.1 acyl-CoA synthetase family member 3, mitochondrial-like [Varroa destructor]